MSAYAPAVPSIPVPSRVAEIRARIAPMSPPSNGAVTGFDAALARAQSDTAWATRVAGTPSAHSISPTAYSSSSVTGSAGDITSTALRHVGVPYVWGGNDPATGLDCSGFTKLVFGSHGVTLPRVSTDQARMGIPVPSLAEALPGDLLAFGSPVDHVAIYLGNGRMVHAAGTGKGVRVDDVYRAPTAIRRLVPQSSATATTRPANGDASVFADLFAASGARHGIDPALLSAVARAESGYDPDAVSRAGAIGLMQFMPSTAAGLGIDPRDPQQAVDGAARYLAHQLTRFGSVELALAAYNAGPGAVARHGGIPPFPETQAYVAKVLALRDELTIRNQSNIGVPT